MSADPKAKASSDPKAKFREALERKRNNQGGSTGPGHTDGKIHSEHGAAGGKRTFRRKSG